MVNKIIIGVFFLILFGIYISTVKPVVGAGDTAELAAACGTLGIAHSPGYPLFTVTGKMGQVIIPFANSAYRVNVLSLIEAFLCALILAALLGFKNIISVCVSIGFLLLSPILWKESIISEVFCLNLLLAGVLAFIICKDIKKDPVGVKDMRGVYIVSFLFGLFLGNHHTLLMFGPGIAFYFFIKIKGVPYGVVMRCAAVAALFFVIGASIYLFLPVRSMAQPLLDWEDPQTWDRFWGVVLRSRYGSLSLAQGEPRGITLATFIEEITFYGKVFVKNYSLAGVLVFALCCVRCYIKERKLLVLSLLFFVFSGPFMFVWANVPHTLHTEYIMERFFLLSLLPVTVIVGFGLRDIDEYLRNTRKWAAIPAAVLVMMITVAFASARQSDFYDSRYSLQVYDTGRNVLKHLPPSSMVFADRADETEFSLAYLKYSMGLREDVSYVDCNAGVSKSIYGDEYYGIWGKRRLAIRDLVEGRIIRSFPGNVYYATVLPGQTVIPKKPEGLLYIAKGKAHRGSAVWPLVLVPPRGGIKGDYREKQMFFSYYKELGDYFLKEKMYGLCEKYYRYYLSSGGNWSTWGLNVAFDLHMSKNSSLAEKFYLGIIRRFPDNKQSWNNLGAVYNESGRLDKADEAFNRAVAIDPDFADAYYNLSVVAWKRGDFKGTERLLELTLNKKPGYAAAEKLLNRIKRKNK